jgi:hypothetical protein
LNGKKWPCCKTGRTGMLSDTIATIEVVLIPLCGIAIEHMGIEGSEAVRTHQLFFLIFLPFLFLKWFRILTNYCWPILFKGKLPRSIFAWNTS